MSVDFCRGGNGHDFIVVAILLTHCVTPRYISYVDYRVSLSFYFGANLYQIFNISKKFALILGVCMCFYFIIVVIHIIKRGELNI